MEHIALAPHVIFHLFHSIPVTASHLALFLITILLFLFTMAVRFQVRLVPGKLQIVVEAIINFFDDMVANAIHDKKTAQRVVPLIMTFFITIFLANLFGILPLVNSVVANIMDHEGHEAVTNIFHVPTTHLSMTLAFAIMAVVLTHMVALTIRPLKHIGNFIKVAGFFKVRSFMDLINAGIDFFLGILEMIGELAKMVSLACRLFGNIFSEEVMLMVIIGLFSFTQFIIPMPFIGLVIFGGILQATVFSMLFTQYLGQAVGHLASEQH